MGSCVSRSGAVSAAAESAHALTAKIVDLDGSMAEFAAPVTAQEALAAARRASSSSSRFLCSSDELDFDAPACALGARDALQAGQLYFALPLSMLHRPLSGQEMAALAVNASAALGAAPVFAAAIDAEGSAVGVPARDKSGGGAAAKQQHRRRQTGRVAPLVVVSGDAGGERKSTYRVHGGHDDARKAVRGGRTVGKTRQGVGYKSDTRRLAYVQRLSVIVEAASE